MTASAPGLAFTPREASFPCGACANCQWNERVEQEVQLQQQGGNGVEVLGGRKPCLREQAFLAKQEREQRALENGR